MDEKILESKKAFQADRGIFRTMRVSIIQCVSTALEMLRFSTDSLIANSGHKEFDYVVVTWFASDDVRDYLSELTKKHDFVHIVNYETNLNVGYVPNLRGMMNCGFDYGFKLNDYCGLVNTDMYFGKDWLKNLVKYAKEDDIVNSTHITPIKGPPYVTANLGIPEYGKFNMDEFNRMYSQLYEDRLETEEDRGNNNKSWFSLNSMPYLFHRKYWEKCGPWELTLDVRNLFKKGYCDTPDTRFFERCHNAGAKFTMSRSSICYHHEKVERTGKRPPGTEGMINEDGIEGKT